MDFSGRERANLRWALLIVGTVSHVIGATAQYGINTLAPFYQGDLELTRTQIGLFMTAFYSGMAGLSLAAGWLADRWGVRTTTLSGHLALGLCTIAAASAPSFSWAFATFFLAGLGYSFLNPASTKGVMEWFERDERATAMGIKQTGVPAGGVVTAVLAPSLVLWIGWRGALAGLGLLNLMFGFAFWVLWRDPAEEAAAIDPADDSPRKSAADLRLRGLIAVSFGTAVLLVAQMSLLTYVPLYLKETMGFSAYWASQALAFTQLGAMIGRIGWGVVSDRLFAAARKTVLVLIGVLSIVILLSMSFMAPATPLIFLLSAIFLAGLCMVGYQGVSYALVGELAGNARIGAALGLVITVNSVGAIFGTPIFGYIVDRTGSYAIAWQVLAGMVLVGIGALALFLEEPKASEQFP